MKNIDKITLLDYLNNYLKTKKSTLTNKTCNTVLKNIILNVSKWETQELFNYILNNKKWSDNSKKTIFTILKSFCNFLKKNNILSNDFNFNDLENENDLNKSKKLHLKQAPTSSQWTALLAALISYRDLEFEFIFKFMAYNGCRISEACNLDYKQFNEDNNYIINYKAKKHGDNRLFWLPPELRIIIKEINYNILNKNRAQKKFNDFLIFFKNQFPQYKNIKFTSHYLRVKFISDAIKIGYPVEKIATLTGHKNITTIQNYYNNPDDETKIKWLTEITDTVFNRYNFKLNEKAYIDLINQLTQQKNIIEQQKSIIESLNISRLKKSGEFKNLKYFKTEKSYKNEILELRRIIETQQFKIEELNNKILKANF